MGALGPSAPRLPEAGPSWLASPFPGRPASPQAYPGQAPPLSLASGLSAHVNYQASASGRCHLHV